MQERCCFAWRKELRQRWSELLEVGGRIHGTGCLTLNPLAGELIMLYPKSAGPSAFSEEEVVYGPLRLRLVPRSSGRRRPRVFGLDLERFEQFMATRSFLLALDRLLSCDLRELLKRTAVLAGCSDEEVSDEHTQGHDTSPPAETGGGTALWPAGVHRAAGGGQAEVGATATLGADLAVVPQGLRGGGSAGL